jgi:hypothetical protein
MKKQKNLKNLSLKKMKISKLNGLDRIIGGSEPENQGEGGASGTYGEGVCISQRPRCRSAQC